MSTEQKDDDQSPLKTPAAPPPSERLGARAVSAQLEALLAPPETISRWAPASLRAPAPTDVEPAIAPPLVVGSSATATTTTAPAQIDASLAKARASSADATANPQAPAPAQPHSKRSEQARLALAGLVGALLASVVFLSIELLRKPEGAAAPLPANLVAVSTAPGAFDPDPADPNAAPGSPGAA